jgi:hypothetical protein
MPEFAPLPKGSPRYVPPTELTVIAWLWIVCGSLWTLLAIPALVAAFQLPAFMGDLAGGDVPADAAARIDGLAKLYATGVVIGMAGAVAGVVSGAGLLRRREWGRRGLVALTTLLLVAVVGFFVVFMWTSLPALNEGHVIFHVAALFGLLVFAVPLWIALKHLRGRAVRQATAFAAFE